MSLLNTINFLPSTFRTSTNQRFFGATLDQLIAPVANTPLNGYIGRKFAPTYKLGDNYVPEQSTVRQNYQLEPSVVIKDASKNILFNSNYIDFLNSIYTHSGLNDNHQRLTKSDTYNYDGHFDYDKFVNYYNYYWLPDGPAAVNVYANQVPYQRDFTVTRNTNINGYVFTGFSSHPNVDLTLARGGSYTFTVDQPGHQFWIQTQPGVSGRDPLIATVDTRQVYGVSNNGTDNGVIRFKVPLTTAQDFYTTMPIKTSVDAAVTFGYTQIQNRLLSEFLIEFPDGLDGLADLTNKTIIFNNGQIDDTQWTVAGVPNVATIIPASQRSSAWTVTLTNGNNAGSRIVVLPGTVINNKEKVFVKSGKTYASSQYWVDQNNRFNIVPAVTANKEYLYYQDSANPGFVGRIKLVDNQTSVIDVEKDILGKIAYTNPNSADNIQFTNGLKIQFDNFVTPADYANRQYYVDGVGTGIRLTAVDQLVVPESFGLNLSNTPDYITINRGSQDLNPWSRSNRWFHTDVINAVAKYNNTTADYGSNLPARRPIIEFEANLQLFQCGKQAKSNVDLIVFDGPHNGKTDAFNDVEGQISATLEGVQLLPGMRIIFANDYDTNIINEVWQVTIPSINNVSYINLIKTTDDPVQASQHVLITQGTNKGNVYYYTGTSWQLSQSKTSVNQAPMFDLVDSNGYSFGDKTVYPNSTFAGTKFFGYPDDATGVNDSILGFPLKHQNFNNIGDIVFANYYDAGTSISPASFEYVLNRNTVTTNFNSGYLFKMNGLTNGTTLNAWTKSTNPTQQFQLITKFFDGATITINSVDTAFVQIDVLPDSQTTTPYLKVYVDNKLLTLTTDYRIETIGIYYVVALNTIPAVGAKIDVEIFSNSVSNLAYFKVPQNLDFNPLNENFNAITLGQLRTHYNTLIENTSLSTTGSIPTQDRYLKTQQGTLYQHSSPLIYAMTFLNNADLNFVNGLTLAKKEYTKFKNKFLSQCESLATLDYKNVIAGVDTILQSINAIKNNTFPWYYSDMVPQGNSYTTINYSVLNVRQTNYEIRSIFDNTVLSNRAVLVWVNGVQQTLGIDYIFSTVSPAIIFSKTFVIGDKIVIRDYFNTDGNYIPETPSKLGLYPKFTPEKYLDTTYQTPVQVIRGHDGSITPAFGDFRDDYLLELERRIYNNIKIDYNKNKINLYDVIPGRFRTTDYSLAEYNSVIAQSFLSWIGTNNLNYTDNSYYSANNSWTWNYSRIPDAMDGQSTLQGTWRAIYKYWYDTDSPNITPWEMLGLTEKPSWWETKYGPAPYTGGNTVLWQDLADGYIWNNGNAYNDLRFARPGLLDYIPVDSAGNLRSPIDIPLTMTADASHAGENFIFGEFGPVETAWRRSSDYVFSVQLMLALTKPAEYFSTNIDISRFYINPTTGQFSTANNQKINTALVVVNGDSTTGTVKRASGYLNWVADYLKNMGVDPVAKINLYLQNLSVQLNYKVAGFTDKNLITIRAEQTTPSSTNASVIIPDSNYTTYLKKSIPIKRVNYSAVVVEKTTNGYSVSGYNTSDPFFTIIPSVADNNARTITVGAMTVRLYQNSTNAPVMVPYGTEYNNIQQVADFLISYERFLVAEGFQFVNFNQDLLEIQDWSLSAKEFVYWAQQGWAEKSIVILNPISTSLTLSTTNMIVDEISNLSQQGKILDQNFTPIKSNNFNILRLENAVNGNQFGIKTLDGSVICFAECYLVQYEHTLIFDNVSDFGDILYVPSQGTRQYRLKLSGSKTGLWSGALSPAGYVYNDHYIEEWTPNRDYRTGDIVTHNTFYYTATKDISAASAFNITTWTQINKTDIKTGLLPSFSLAASEFDNFYDLDIPPTNEQFQAYSGGLIGFRQRPYLTVLGVSIPTQTKFYQGFIKEKGSLNSITALTNANFNNVSGNISINEEWAFRAGVYGGVNHETFKEFVLDQSVFHTNPVAFTSANVYNNSNIIVNLNGNTLSKNGNVLTSNVYNASNLISTTTSLYYNRSGDMQYEFDLPYTGFVNINDTDYQIFDITNFTSPVDNIGVGNKVWVAKNYSGSWGIYRVNAVDIVATRVTYGLDSYVAINFDKPHQFYIGNSFVLKYFGNNLDGVYNIVATPSPTEVIVSVTNADAIKSLIRNVSLTGVGTVYSLDSVNVDSVKDISKLYPLHGWINNDHVWVNHATLPPPDMSTPKPQWAVYTYNRTWLSNAAVKLTADTTTANARFGSGVKISSDSAYTYVASPNTNQVKVFGNVNGTYTGIRTVTSTDNKFGTAIDSHGNLTAIASSANVYVYSTDGSTVVGNVISSANVSSITSISMSHDQHWLYVGDSSHNIVEAWYTNDLGANLSYVWQSKISGTGAFGAAVKTNNSGNVLVITSPDQTVVNNRSGNVNVYSVAANGAISLTQTIASAYHNDSANFGYSLAMSPNAENLYIGSPRSTAAGFTNGIVERFVANITTGLYDVANRQTIAHPNKEIGNFGSSVGVSANGKFLAVGSLGSPSKETTTFDNSMLIIDSSTTLFVDYIMNSGAVYLFEPLFDQTNPHDIGEYTFTQELETQVHSGDGYGNSIDVKNNLIVVGSPGENKYRGSAHVFTKNKHEQSWSITRRESPVVDINSISRTFIYNKINNNILAALDFIDPNKGKVLQAVDADIDFKRVADPAFYNQGTNTIYSDFAWGPKQVGRVWWDISKVRYISYEQDDLNYRLNHWGQMFPNSSIDVYEWVESTDLPSNYPVANGTPLAPDNSAFCTYGFIDTNNTVQLKYYFWVKNRNIINRIAGKNNSVLNIAAAIENPLSQGIPYATVLRDDTIALHNVVNLINGQSSVIQIGSKIGDGNIVHSEYALVQEGNPQSKIPTPILNKLIDSLAGIDSGGNLVPDPALIPSQRYGVGLRPRQTMIVNRDLAFANYLVLVNSYLLAYPVVERKVLTILNSEESIPTAESGRYNTTVNTFEELGYIQTTDNNGTLLPAFTTAGYKVLVLSDVNYTNKWAIYTWTGSAWVTTTADIQSYKTNQHWSYADWYDSSYNSSSTPDITVATQLDLGKLSLVAGQHIKVSDAGNGKFVIYQIDSSLKLNVVGIESGTIQISTDTIPNKETRQILLAMQENIFIEDLANQLNKIFFTTIKYILSEQKNIDWIFKTSFVSATQNIRKLEEFAAYIPDNQNFYLDYIDEVKPYRTIVREFIVDYQRNDNFNGDITDFDIPAYWDKVMQVYRGPSGEQSYDNDLLQTGVYSQWYNNYTNGVVDVIIENPGSGYLFAPQVIISGNGTGATAEAVLDGNGGIASVTIVKSGSGYTSIPDIKFNGTGTGAIGRAILRNVFTGENTGHNVVRSITTKMKFDRINYTNANTFVFWDTITSANIGDLITSATVLNLNNNLYKLNNDYVITGDVGTNSVNFPLANVTQINARDFDNANDRIVAFNGNVSLGSVFNGIDYPGVVVDGGNLRVIDGDTTAGSPARPMELDAIIQSRYSDNIGVDPSDVIIAGGKYVDTFSSHAPEELIPGRMFDSLNMSVFDTNQIGFRLFNNMSTVPSYYRISAVASTKLSANLNLADTTIKVISAASLPNPNHQSRVPGIVFINGEKIIYWRNYAMETPVAWTANATIGTSTVITYSGNTYLTTGNVFGAYFANIAANVSALDVNTLGQIRRAADGTSPAMVHLAGSYVADGSIYQLIPSTGANASTTTTSVTYKTSDNATLRLKITAPISANIGDLLTQYNSATATTISYMRIMQNVVNASEIPVILLSGVLEYTPDYFDGNISGVQQTFDTLGFDATANAAVRLNNVPVTSVSGKVPYIYDSSPISTLITLDGTVTVPSGTPVKTQQAWYNRGIGTATDGTGLINSFTPQAIFLIGSKAYTP